LEFGGQAFGRLVAGEHGLEAVLENVVERLRGEDVDVVAEVGAGVRVRDGVEHGAEEGGDVEVGRLDLDWDEVARFFDPAADGFRGEEVVEELAAASWSGLAAEM
jgi:hypothetical protein